MFLLDTVVVSESFKLKPDPAVVDWLKSVASPLLFLSVVTAGALQRGIRKLEAADERRPERVVRWSQETIGSYGDRVLPITIQIAKRWGELCYQAGNTNPDLFIAATALEHDLTVVTRNVRRFEPTGAKVFNPYAAA